MWQVTLFRCPKGGGESREKGYFGFSLGAQQVVSAARSRQCRIKRQNRFTSLLLLAMLQLATSPISNLWIFDKTMIDRNIRRCRLERKNASSGTQRLFFRGTRGQHRQRYPPPGPKLMVEYRNSALGTKFACWTSYGQ